MDRYQPLWFDLCDRLSELGRHHMARAMNLIHWKSKMVQPIGEPIMVNLHLFIERLGAAVDVGAARAGLDVQDFVHIIGAGSKDYLRLHVSNVLRSLHGHSAENIFLPIVVGFLGSLIDRDMWVPDHIGNFKVLVVG